MSETSNWTSQIAQSAAAHSDADNEDYVPPKAETFECAEEGAFYSVRCKLYYSQSAGWQDKGVGVLFMKPCGNKTQLIIRADNKIGTIMLNIMLQKSMPMARTGTNAVTMVCVPNPPNDPKHPTKVCPLLIKVKTADEADKLFAALNDKK